MGRNPFSIKIGVVGEGVGAEGDLQLLLSRSLSGEWVSFPCLKTHSIVSYMSPVKRICVFEHSVMTNFNCPCPAIQRGQGSGFLSEGSS